MRAFTVNRPRVGGVSITTKGYSGRTSWRASLSRKWASNSPISPPAGDVDAGLLARLKQLRLALARERGVPAYVIFADRALDDMARRRPRNEAEFAEVHGVGAAKLRDFAAPFLAAIAAAGEEP